MKEVCEKHFGPQIEKGLVCDVLAGECGPSCNKMAQIPNKKGVLHPVCLTRGGT